MDPIAESSCSLSVQRQKESPIVHVSSVLRLASQQIVERTALVVQAIIGDKLTLEEEDTLAQILSRCNALSLKELTTLTESFLLMRPSDELSVSRARQALETLIADKEMGSMLGHWIEAVRIRARHVRWLRSASEGRQLLKRKDRVVTELVRVTPSLEALKLEKEELSATNNRLKAEITAVEKEHNSIRVSLEELTGQRAG